MCVCVSVYDYIYIYSSTTRGLAATAAHDSYIQALPDTMG